MKDKDENRLTNKMMTFTQCNSLLKRHWEEQHI